jgi:hypothetical protein
MTVATLNDARVMIERRVPAASRANEMWRYAWNQIREAALGGDMRDSASRLLLNALLKAWALPSDAMIYPPRGAIADGFT